MSRLPYLLLATALALPTAIPASAQTKIEGIHHWVAESEVNALKVVTAKLAEKGFVWQDSAVGGMNGGAATQVLRTRIAAGNPPATMQLLGFEGIAWAKEGALRSLNDLYSANGWEATLPPAVIPFIKASDEFFAAPINMHRQNWVWANKAIFDRHGIAEPKTWEELLAAAHKLKDAGVTPIAMSSENWQVMQIFEAMLVDMNGPEFFRKAVSEHDKAALTSDSMIKTFDMLREISKLADEGATGRDWAVATNMVASGDAAMQIMGDWAKGEFLGRDLKPGVDFLCFPTPSATPNYKFVIDAFGTFKTRDQQVNAGQDAWIEALMNPEVQTGFNLIKGSIPVRMDVSVEAFDECAKRSQADRLEAVKTNTMIGTLTDSLATPPEFAGVFMDVVGQFFVTDMSSQDAVAMLVDGLANAQ